MLYVVSLDAVRFKILVIRLNSYTISSRSSVLKVNRIVQLSRSRAFSRQIVMTLLESFLVADKNVKLFTIFFSRWNDSWYKTERIERDCESWLSFELSRNWLHMYKRAMICIKLLWDVLLNIASFMMMNDIESQCCKNVIHKSRLKVRDWRRMNERHVTHFALIDY